MAAKQNDIDTYISRFPKDMRERLEKVRTTIRKAAPEAEELISYAMPAYRKNGILVWFAGFANHLGLYPGVSGIVHFRKELLGYKSAKGSVQFPHNKRLPLGLISKIVKFRLKENKAREAHKNSGAAPPRRRGRAGGK